MGALHIDPSEDRGELYGWLYAGDIVVFTRLPSVAALVSFAKEQLAALFSPHDPEEAHRHFSPSEMASLLGEWKPRFIHDERSSGLVRAIIREVGLSGEQTHFDLPKPRTAFPSDHLTTGIAFAFPWHRDTWYSAPPQQINWWLPIFEVRRDNAMKFDLGSFRNQVPNDSASFDYYRINIARATTATQVGKETQSRPRAIDHLPSDEFIVLPPPGSVMLFSGAQLHATIPNTSGRSRFSIDFRTVDVEHVAARTGAPLVDVDCTGTALRDFMNVESGARVEEDLVRSVYGLPPDDAVLWFS